MLEVQYILKVAIVFAFLSVFLLNAIGKNEVPKLYQDNHCQKSVNHLLVTRVSQIKRYGQIRVTKKCFIQESHRFFRG